MISPDLSRDGPDTLDSLLGGWGHGTRPGVQMERPPVELVMFTMPLGLIEESLSQPGVHTSHGATASHGGGVGRGDSGRHGHLDVGLGHQKHVRSRKQLRTHFLQPPNTNPVRESRMPTVDIPEGGREKPGVKKGVHEKTD